MGFDRRLSLQGSRIRQQLKRWQEGLLMAPVVTVAVVLTNITGIFQVVEWAALDKFFRLRPLEPIDSRITIVTISEADLAKAGKWPIPDAVLAKAIQNLKAHQPSVIGLDLYRNLPEEPGHADLLKIYQTTPNLIGVEKAIGSKVDPPPELAKKEQVAIADVALDTDTKVRRSLLYISYMSEIKLSLGAKTALDYLKTKSIIPQPSEENPNILHLGKAEFQAFAADDGGYIRADDGGFQVLLNFRGSDSHFQSISLSDVVDNRFPAQLVRDRMILIGTIAASGNDFLRIPFYSKLNDSWQTPGVYVHANIASQIVSAALDGRPLIQVWSEPAEWLWALGWSLLGFSGVRVLMGIRKQGKPSSSILIGIIGLLSGTSLVPIHYGLFLAGIWVPFMPALLSFYGAAAASLLIQTQRLQGLAYIDELTQVVNRRYFDQFLQQQLLEQRTVSLILCDIDYFKRYNDTYGHQAGDLCLRQVAQAMRKTVRDHDLVARYGGEEFAIVLPNANLDIAAQVAERVRKAILSLEIPHKASEVHSCVTLSAGVTCSYKDAALNIKDLISLADTALYEAKKQGRNQFARYVLPTL